MGEKKSGCLVICYIQGLYKPFRFSMPQLLCLWEKDSYPELCLQSMKKKNNPLAKVMPDCLCGNYSAWVFTWAERDDRRIQWSPKAALFPIQFPTHDGPACGVLPSTLFPLVLRTLLKAEQRALLAGDGAVLTITAPSISQAWEAATHTVTVQGIIHPLFLSDSSIQSGCSGAISELGNKALLQFQSSDPIQETFLLS